jgi:hypothetical protein
MRQMSIPRKAFSISEIHRVESGTVAWAGWLTSEGHVVAIGEILPEGDDAVTSYLAWMFGPDGVHTSVPITVQRPLMRILSGTRPWAPAAFLCEGCAHGVPLSQRWGAVRVDGTGVVAAPFAEHVACSQDVTFSEAAGGKTVDVIMVDTPRGGSEPPVRPRWLDLHEEGVAEVGTSRWNWPRALSDPDVAVDRKGHHWLVWAADRCRCIVASEIGQQGFSEQHRIIRRVGAKREVSSPRVVRGAHEDLVLWREYNGETKRDTRDSSLFFLPLLSGKKPPGMPTRITPDREVISWDVVGSEYGPVVFWNSGMSTQTRSTHVMRMCEAGGVGPEVKLPFPRGEMAVPLRREILVLGYDASGLVGQPRRGLLAAVVALP